MAVNWRNAVFFALAVAVSTAGAVAQAETPDYRPARSEAVLTPRFCWKQFMGNKFSAPQFQIPHKTCGAFVNHYCYGLIDLNRANRTIGNVAKKRAYLLEARKNTLYTLRGIKRFPSCPIRTHAENTLRVIEIQLRAFR